MSKDTFTKKRCYAILGYSYAGAAFVCAVFDTLIDAEEYIQSQEDGWIYRVEYTFYKERKLPF